MTATINRALLVVRPKQPFADWVTSVDPENPVDLDGVRHDCTAYLVDETVMETDVALTLEHHFEDILENELWAWYTDESLWPTDRSLDTFHAWFEVITCSSLFDLSEERLEREE
jgi:hypothetical protein